jgi:hypothetical protein
MRETNNTYRILVGKPKGNKPLRIFEKIILKWILERMG